MTLVRKMLALAVAAAALLFLGAGNGSLAAQSHTSKPFAGVKVNGGTVTHSVQNGRHVLTLSGDFKVPDTPDPHWQVVDASGRVYLLQRLGVKGGVGGDRINTSITLPAHVESIAKVQIYCAWAEALLGELEGERVARGDWRIDHRLPPCATSGGRQLGCQPAASVSLQAGSLPRSTRPTLSGWC